MKVGKDEGDCDTDGVLLGGLVGIIMGDEDSRLAWASDGWSVGVSLGKDDAVVLGNAERNGDIDGTSDGKMLGKLLGNFDEITVGYPDGPPDSLSLVIADE